ncbi:far upstream element-binding protein 1-like [Tripterygium wilfordii]|nr:far upstream element-binding protein 1-like [Tripterygium wilfordii]
MSEHEETIGAENDSSKRKLEDSIQVAKQRAQELASRLVTDAESKRPRLSDSPDPSPLPAPIPAPSYPVSYAAPPSQYTSLQGTTKKISIPNGKVGVVIGKGGETINYLQLQSGAKIQIAKDSEVDPHSLTRDVELMGTSEQISRAEQLINDVIAGADAGGSASSTQGLNSMQPGANQFAMKVPNNRVALLIGKGGETIKTIQSRSGARMQIIPLRLPPGDTSTERTVYINGSDEQIEAAKELVDEIISGKRITNTYGPSSYMQPAYPPPSNVVSQGQFGQPGAQQQPQYGYTQPDAQFTSPYYSNYSQPPSASLPNPSAVSQTAPQSTGYGYYGQQIPAVSTPFNPSYSYSQAPPAEGSGYDQGHSQPTYGLNVSSGTHDQQAAYAASFYGQTTSSTDGAVSLQSNNPSYPYAQAYSQPTANLQAVYYAPSSFMHPPPAQTGYDQTYSQTTYGGSQGVPAPPPQSQPVYGQGGYTMQPPPAPENYYQGTNHPDYGQPPAAPEPSTQATQPPLNGS